MFDPQMELLTTVLADVIERLEENPEGTSAWTEAAAAVSSAKEEDEDLLLAIECKELEELRAILNGWMDGSRLMCLHDRDVLKRAMKAYRKSLKITILDAESGLGVGPMSDGKESGICGIRPPERYPIDVWNELARQKRLIDAGQGTFELPPGG
ncbi:MAG: hypothetical protein ACI8TQ_003565 [Planctomycetota bacterium]|jgi:hypothetical protein